MCVTFELLNRLKSYTFSKSIKKYTRKIIYIFRNMPKERTRSNIGRHIPYNKNLRLAQKRRTAEQYLEEKIRLVT